MHCPDIEGLTFDQSSLDALEEIRQKKELGKVLATVLAGSVWVKIFIGRTGLANPFGIGWSISQYQWEVWAESMKASHPIVSASIKRIAHRETERHSGKEFKFWEAMMYGCDH